jgi:trigger factor
MIINKKTNKGSVELEIEVSVEDYQPFLDKAALRLANKVKIAGFRPGKAPLAEIKKQVGEMSLYQEALDEIVNHFYYQVLKQEKLEAATWPKVEIVKLAPGNPIVFKATVDLMPTVTFKDYREVKLKPVEVKKVADKEVNTLLDQLRSYGVKENPVERKAEMGDLVSIDFQVSLDGVGIEGGQGQKYPLVLGSNSMIPGFEEKLVGAEKDQEVVFKLKFPEEYMNAMLKGKEADFKVKVLSVSERVLPETTDDWAKGMGAKDLNDLKENIKKDLEHQAIHEADHKNEEQVLEKLLEITDFDIIPESLTTEEGERMADELKADINARGIVWEDYLQRLKKTQVELLQDFLPAAMKRVKTSLAIKSLAELEKLDPTPEQIKDELDRLIKMSPDKEKELQSPAYQRYIGLVLRNKLTIEFLRNLWLPNEKKHECSHDHNHEAHE